ncbi:hypothetical protein CIPAW_16G090700 [Carya illinoinensis]|uniref:Uncharacterized protein n=1 Tax=Carya illinoinensis TaxID=32201 RepID=A0A8T1N5N9_CARIL|nr:hypothetical protein CIPAW_16G090700 [Carya illinoinensis]
MRIAHFLQWKLPCKEIDQTTLIVYPVLMFFSIPGFKGPLTSFEHHPPHILLTQFSFHIVHHKAFLSLACHHNYIQKRALLNNSKFLRITLFKSLYITHYPRGII